MKAFYAYPNGKQNIHEAILGAADLMKSTASIQPWKSLTVAGFRLDDLIREKILEADLLLADVTFANQNVYYEMGFAISSGISVLPTINITIDKATSRLHSIGLLDNIGWLTYSNAEDLARQFDEWEGLSWMSNYKLRRNYVQPLFVLDTVAKTDFRNHIFHAVDNSQVNVRSFDPTEVPRLSAAQAISEVSSSAGVIVQILKDDIIDSCRNNLRAAFILGLCHGYHVDSLAIQYEHGPAAADYREFITNSTYRRETEQHVERFCTETLISNQKAIAFVKRPGGGILSEIDLGSPTAENETLKLKYYFVETAEFARALRAEGAVVIGRKGSGKTAVYLQVAERAIKNRDACVVDLRPASHNLSEMREALLAVISAGVFDHTIVSFWQYILYMEILLKIREMALPMSRNDFDLQERIRKVEKEFSLTDSIVAGDFTSRLEMAVKEIVRGTKEQTDQEKFRNQFTNIMFEQPIPRLRRAIEEFSDQYEYIFVLIDDLDKGWPPTRVNDHDIAMVRHLIEALNKIQRDLGRKKLELKHLLFLRSDIYENLVELTSDRGKYNLIRVDWSDPKQLRHLLKQRVMNNIDFERSSEAWAAFNQTFDETMDVVSRMIEGSLRRPRFLIDLCERTLSSAINRGHSVVTKDDVEEGMRQMSLYLVSDFGYEMRDVSGAPEDIFYLFIGAPELLTYTELCERLSQSNLGIGTEETVELLLWYGFLGIIGPTNNAIYIYDRAYDFRRLKAELSNNSGDALYAVNPAFLRGLVLNQKSVI